MASALLKPIISRFYLAAEFIAGSAKRRIGNNCARCDARLDYRPPTRKETGSLVGLPSGKLPCFDPVLALILIQRSKTEGDHATAVASDHPEPGLEVIDLARLGGEG